MASAPEFSPFARIPCGCWFKRLNYHERQWLPQVQLESHTTILGTTSRTTLRQTFHNPQSYPIYEAAYTFPLTDGVSIAGFTYTVADRTVMGVVKERGLAQFEYETARRLGQTAGLLEQIGDAGDSFTTSIGNIPGGEDVLVEITYLGELKNSAETDAARFTLPTTLAPRYGRHTAMQRLGPGNIPMPSVASRGIKITVDIMLEEGSIIQGIQSPSHPISVSMGRNSAFSDVNDDDSFANNLGSATLTLGTAELDKDFVLEVMAKGQDTPKALLETHPTIPDQRALLATLVPRFNIADHHPEIVFVVDRSGSMDGKMHLVVDALKVFLKSLPLGIKFNICGFGSVHGFLFQRSREYDASSLEEAMDHIESAAFRADLGGTEMVAPTQDVLKRRYNDLPLQIMLMTDGQIWNQEAMFKIVNEASSNNNARFFTLGIGSSASSSLVEGIARAGRGFAQFVLDGERIDKRIVRMLRGALSPSVHYRLEVRYAPEVSDEDDFEIIDSFEKNIKVVVTETIPNTPKVDPGQLVEVTKKKVSLFDKFKKTTADEKTSDTPRNIHTDKYARLPSIPVPRVLQYPHEIPEVYSHNRTSVYLLLSPEADGRTPEAVILRGTTDKEELEIEIPVQDVGKGDTIHRMAVKKITQELEEGRGWLTALRTANGKTLKSQQEEHKWDLIVDREAVRLCTTFQVAGRHASFVAVQKSDQNASSTTENASDVVLQPPLPEPSREDRALQESLKGRRLFGAAPVGASTFGASSTGGGGLFGTAPGGARPGGPSAFGAPTTRGGGLFSSISSTDRMSSSGFTERRKSAGLPRTREAPSPTLSAAPTFPAPASFTTDTPDETVTLSALDNMQALISLQNFTGSWSMSDRLMDIISHGAKTKFSSSNVKEIVTDAIAVKSSSRWVDDLTDDDWATVVAIAWLEELMKDEKDVWEMVVEKARGYLEGRVDGSDEVDILVDDVRDLWKSEP